MNKKPILLIASVVIVLGLVGADDYSQEVKQEEYKCKMIESGAWGAGKEQREICKALGW